MSALGRWTSPDPLADDFPAHSPFNYSFNNPLAFTDPTGLSPEDIILRGQNSSSVTIKTALIDVEVDVSSLPGTDFGGSHTIGGEGVVLAGLDIAGTFDPTPASDALAASIYAGKGQYGDVLISGLVFIPAFGDVGKLARVGKHIDAVKGAISTSKRGGRYSEVRAANVGGEVHHMPANSASPLNYGDGPAIWMETLDHRQTASWGRGQAQDAYRDAHRQLIKKGRFDDAVQMDIDDVRSKFDGKYDTAILQMIDSLK